MHLLKSKFIACAMIFFLTFGAVINVQREARAFWPLVIPLLAGTEITISSGGAVGLAGVATAIGLTAWLLSFKKADNTVGLTVKINPKAPSLVPSGWSAAPDPASEPVPPSTASPTGTLYTIDASQGGGCASGGCTSSTFDSVCRAWKSGVSGTIATFTNNGTICAVTFDPSGSQSAIVNTSVSCPAGYTNSSGTCVITTPSAVKYPADGKCQVDLSTGTFVGKSQDPDCDGGPAPGMTLSPDNKKIVVEEGAKKTVITSMPDNSIKIENWTGNGNGTSTYTSATIGPPDSGSPTGGSPITGFSTGNVPGEGSTAGDGSSTGTGGSANCGAPGQPPCRIDETGTPSGTNHADTQKSQLEGKTPSDFGANPWTGTGISIFNGLPSLSGSDSCVNPITWVWMGHEMHPDVCSVWSPLKSWFSWLLWALTAVYIWKRTTNAAAV